MSSPFDIFGTTPAHDAAEIYSQCRRGHASHMAAYAMLVEDFGAECADAAVVIARGWQSKGQDFGMGDGWTRRELVAHEAGI